MRFAFFVLLLGAKLSQGDAASREACPASPLPVSELTGIWEGYHFASNRFFSLNIGPSGEGDMIFVFGPPDASGFQRLKIDRLVLRGHKLHVETSDQTMKVVLDGCADAVGGQGVVNGARLTISNKDGAFPKEILVPFYAGTYLERRRAYQGLANKARASGASSSSPQKLQKPEGDDGFLWGLPADESMRKKHGKVK